LASQAHIIRKVESAGHDGLLLGAIAECIVSIRDTNPASGTAAATPTEVRYRHPGINRHLKEIGWSRQWN
jgi:hypothetical protein